MKYGFVLPFGDATKAAEMAYEAEQAGWDGFFVWEPMWGVDAWVALAAATMKTRKIKLGTMLSPISRMRPWKLASETTTLDVLSNGRVILSVGLGAINTGFKEFGEETNRVKRAELVDEGLDILWGLWKGQPFKYEGKHYTIQKTDFPSPINPIQKPRIPIWMVGAWFRKKSMNRVLRCDGLIPTKMVGREHIKVEPNDIRDMKEWIMKNRKLDTPFDIIIEGKTPVDESENWRDIVTPYYVAGATWWIESMWELSRKDGNEPMLKRLRAGPPRV